jgi:predicted amidophosphoribosyltransferase
MDNPNYTRACRVCGNWYKERGVYCPNCTKTMNYGEKNPKSTKKPKKTTPK